MSPEVDKDLEVSLKEFEGKDAKALQKAIKLKLAEIDCEDLTVYPDDELGSRDTVVQSRITYVVSLLRLLSFLKKKALTWDDAEKQARLSLAYIKHAESKGLDALQPGRTSGDDRLLEDIALMKRQLDEHVEYRAKALIAEQNAQKTKNIPQRAGSNGTPKGKGKASG